MDKDQQSSQRVDAVQYKLGMRTLAAAVNIITSIHSGHRYGMTATAVCSVTADPPTLLVCIKSFLVKAYWEFFSARTWDCLTLPLADATLTMLP